MSTCDGVGHIPGHWKIIKTLAPEDEVHVQIQRGGGAGRGSGPLLEITNIQGFFSNTGPDPGALKIVKLPSQLSILGHNRHASETSIKWRFAGGLKRVR